MAGDVRMSIHGKRELIGKADLIALAKITAIKTWPEAAETAGVAQDRIRQVQASQRFGLLEG